MVLTFYDLETTGLNAGKDDVAQAALIDAYVDREQKRVIPLQGRSLYFYHEGMVMSDEASKVNGLTISFLKQYKDKFYENMCYLYSKMNNGYVCGFNNRHFDDVFTKSWFERMGFEPPQIACSYDMMRDLAGFMHKGRFSLVSAAEATGQIPAVTSAVVKSLVKGAVESPTSHDAAYDAYSTLQLYAFGLSHDYL